MKKLKQFIYYMPISLSILITGCASTCTSIPSGTDKNNKIGTSFFNKIEVSQPQSTHLQNGFTQATANISNLSSDAQLVQYRVIWFNEDGTPIDNNMPWSPLQLYPELSKTVAAISPTETATKYHVEACMLKPTNNLVSFYRD
jgi:uncharacterized protein YcfL